MSAQPTSVYVQKSDVELLESVAEQELGDRNAAKRTVIRYLVEQVGEDA
jgi:hypothetical protein